MQRMANFLFFITFESTTDGLHIGHEGLVLFRSLIVLRVDFFMDRGSHVFIIESNIWQLLIVILGVKLQLP